MKLSDMIYKRKSVRAYTGEPIDYKMIHQIKEFTTELVPLYPEIKVRTEILGKESVKCILPWTAPQVIAIFSEDKDGAHENVGFMFGQLDLYLQSLGLGTCWLGMGRLDSGVRIEADGDLKFMIMIAFGYPKDLLFRESVSEFKRRPLSEISDRVDDRLEPARLAPSSVNSQPWYFKHEGDVIHAYRVNSGILKLPLGDMNKIDMGIALSHMYVANSETFVFFKSDKVPKLKGATYTGSFTM